MESFLQAHYLGTLHTYVAMDPLGSQFPVGVALTGNEDAEGGKYFLGKLESAMKVPDQDGPAVGASWGLQRCDCPQMHTTHGSKYQGQVRQEMFGRFKHLYTAPSYRFLPMFDAPGRTIKVRITWLKGLTMLSLQGQECVGDA